MFMKELDLLCELKLDLSLKARSTRKDRVCFDFSSHFRLRRPQLDMSVYSCESVCGKALEVSPDSHLLIKKTKVVIS